MINCSAYFEMLKLSGIEFFAGVPDSLLKSFCAYIADHSQPELGHISANEGAAVALAAGHYLATEKMGMVYMQNSGLGNAVNPLTSLVDPEVYGIPVLLLIGWRGEPGRYDEPQHVKQGKVTLPMLDTLGISYAIHPESLEEAKSVIEHAIAVAKKTSSPYALVIRDGTFGPYNAQKKISNSFEVSREQAIKGVSQSLRASDVIVCTTGKASRELFEHRAASGSGHDSDFLTVGSMGHASQIALGIAFAKPNREVVCIDGDGALIMHMGALAIVGAHASKNFKHVVINNGTHDSVGGQATAAHTIDIPAISRACGYREARRITVLDSIGPAMDWLRSTPGPALLEIMTKTGARADLGRPTISPIDNKKSFMKNLSQ